MSVLILQNLWISFSSDNVRHIGTNNIASCNNLKKYCCKLCISELFLSIFNWEMKLQIWSKQCVIECPRFMYAWWTNAERINLGHNALTTPDNEEPYQWPWQIKFDNLDMQGYSVDPESGETKIRGDVSSRHVFHDTQNLSHTKGNIKTKLFLSLVLRCEVVRLIGISNIFIFQVSSTFYRHGSFGNLSYFEVFSCGISVWDILNHLISTVGPY